MSFTLGVENAPSPAIQWMAMCNLGAGPNMPGPLPLSERWDCTEPAPGANWMEIACFDAEGYIVQEAAVEGTLEDGRDYMFDFATETLQEITPPAVSWLPLAILGGMGIVGIGGAIVAATMIKPKE